MCDRESAETVQATKKLPLIGNADDDEVRMRTIGRKKGSDSFEDCVA